MRKALLFFSILLLLPSCGEYTYVPKDRRPCWKDNDIIYFVNHFDKRLVDTFLVKVTYDYEVTNSTSYEEHIYVNYQKINNYSSINKFSLNYNHPVYVRSFRFVNVTNLKIGAIKYNPASVYVPDKKDTTGTLPDTIYLNNKEGILRYDYSKTNYYEIMN